MRQEGESRKLISTSRVEEPKIYGYWAHSGNSVGLFQSGN